MIELETARLRLVPLVAADAAELVVVLSDPALYGFTGGSPPSLAGLRERFERWEERRSPDGCERWLNWTLRRRADCAAVGYVQATIDAGGTAAIAYVIGTPWQGDGLASEAAVALVEWLATVDGFHAVTAHIAAGHVASERVASHAGLRLSALVDADGERVWVRSLA